MQDAGREPLPVLLSRALVAFTIELDNEWERRVAFKATDFGGRGLWACSLRQWANCLRWIPPEGIAVPELTRAARAKPQLDAMRRWGYIRIDGRTVRDTAPSLRAGAVWKALVPQIEERWGERLGSATVARVRAALEQIAGPLRDGLPDWLSTGWAGRTVAPMAHGVASEAVEDLALSALLSVPLQRFALEVERGSPLSLMHGLNVVARLDREGLTLGELVRCSGVAAPALRPAIRFGVQQGLLVAGRGHGGRVALTEQGVVERRGLAARIARVEARWMEDDAVREARAALERLLVGREELWPHLEPPAESWRSQVPRPQVLPDFPMPRQGGHPDGV